MIKKISKVSSFGILDNYSPDKGLLPFNKYNIIYGWNGSGKTTLGRLFRHLETGKPHDEFPQAKFSLELSSGIKFSSDKPEHNLQIRVFNSDFVTDNLNLFDAKTKSIIFLSKEKIDEKKELEAKKVELEGKASQLAAFEKSKRALDIKSIKYTKTREKPLKHFCLEPCMPM
ncbi:MAG: AAA family ATPase [Flavipsychrobacter sp.]|nr:AAA family ATPase [Flavipsychrobacter sp.]